MASQTEIDQVLHKRDFGIRMSETRGDTLEAEMFWDGWNLAIENMMLIFGIKSDKQS